MEYGYAVETESRVRYARSPRNTQDQNKTLNNFPRIKTAVLLTSADHVDTVTIVISIGRHLTVLAEGVRNTTSRLNLW